MKIMLTKEESEKLFFDALCNGLSMLTGYGCSVIYKPADYTAAHKRIQKKLKKQDTVSYEDVLMELLRMRKRLQVVDNEDEKSEQNVSISLEDVHKRVAKTPLKHLVDAVEEDGDAITADCILQTVFFKSIVYG